MSAQLAAPWPSILRGAEASGVEAFLGVVMEMLGRLSGLLEELRIEERCFLPGCLYRVPPQIQTAGNVTQLWKLLSELLLQWPLPPKKRSAP